MCKQFTKVLSAMCDAQILQNKCQIMDRPAVLFVYTLKSLRLLKQRDSVWDDEMNGHSLFCQKDKR